MAQVEIALENYEAAEAHLGECDALCDARPVGMPTYVAGNRLYWSITAAAQGEMADAWEHVRFELEAAVRRQDRLNLANALAASAFISATENEVALAVERYALARQHQFVAHSHWFEDVVGKPVQAAANSLPPAKIDGIQGRSAATDLETAAAVMLAQFDPPPQYLPEIRC